MFRGSTPQINKQQNKLESGAWEQGEWSLGTRLSTVVHSDLVKYHNGLLVLVCVVTNYKLLRRL